MSNKLMNEMKAVLKAGENLIIEGTHGTGKTMMIKELFDAEFGPGKWAFFSASTMDPFIDFVGCPKEVTAPDGVTYLDLIRPERFARDQIEAIFIDEFNRAPKKVKNALMELLQFKEINGKKFNNLKIVWAAINPSDGVYDVEEMDPAQLDRFHAHLKMDGHPSREFFTQKFDADVAEGAIGWWNGLPTEMKKMVSPRRLEYALTGYLKHSNPITLYLDPKTNPQKLINDIKSGSIDLELKKLKTPKEKKDFLKNEKNWSKIKFKLQDEEFLADWMLYFPAEKMSQTIAAIEGDAFNKIVASVSVHYLDSDELTNLKDICQEIVNANNNKDVIKKIEESDILNI